MELQPIILQLERRLREVELTIAALEGLQNGKDSNGVSLKSNRGRKSMGSEERKIVSERMKKYWASRR